MGLSLRYDSCATARSDENSTGKTLKTFQNVVNCLTNSNK